MKSGLLFDAADHLITKVIHSVTNTELIIFAAKYGVTTPQPTERRAKRVLNALNDRVFNDKKKST